MKVDFISLISNDIIAHGFSLDIPERWILVGLVLVVIRVTRRSAWPQGFCEPFGVVSVKRDLALFFSFECC